VALIALGFPLDNLAVELVLYKRKLRRIELGDGAPVGHGDEPMGRLVQFSSKTKPKACELPRCRVPARGQEPYSARALLVGANGPIKFGGLHEKVVAHSGRRDVLGGLRIPQIQLGNRGGLRRRLILLPRFGSTLFDNFRLLVVNLAKLCARDFVGT
jgi:hypothetical protein